MIPEASQWDLPNASSRGDTGGVCLIKIAGSSVSAHESASIRREPCSRNRAGESSMSSASAQVRIYRSRAWIHDAPTRAANIASAVAVSRAVSALRMGSMQTLLVELKFDA